MVPQTADPRAADPQQPDPQQPDPHQPDPRATAPRATAPQAPDLPGAIAAQRAGGATEQQTERAFRAATLWFQRPERPGFLAVDADGGPLIAVHSSLEQLVRHAGACDWASTSGDDLLDLLPSGHRLLLDPLGPDPQLIDPAGWRAGSAGPAEADRG
ncbi:hypothetical protein ACWGB8_11880 [Kitasatospora sp. NPDC054939]